MLAELYYHTGLIDRANKQLRAYKRTLDSNMQSEDIKAINQAMQIMQSKRQVGFEWNEFWDKREGSKTSENSDITLETQMQIPTSDEER